jgi:hypothetical protein
MHHPNGSGGGRPSGEDERPDQDEQRARTGSIN